MALEDALLDILVCPIDKRGLLYFADDAVLYNPRLRRLYRIENDIPLMLPKLAVPVPDEEHNRLMKCARRGEVTAITAGEADCWPRATSPAAGTRSVRAGPPGRPRRAAGAGAGSVRVVHHEPHPGRAQHRGQRAAAADGAVEPPRARVVRRQSDVADPGPVVPDHRARQQLGPRIEHRLAVVPGRPAVGLPRQQQHGAAGRAGVDHARGGQPPGRVPGRPEPPGGAPGQAGQQQHRRQQGEHPEGHPGPVQAGRARVPLVPNEPGFIAQATTTPKPAASASASGATNCWASRSTAAPGHALVTDLSRSRPGAVTPMQAISSPAIAATPSPGQRRLAGRRARYPARATITTASHSADQAPP